MAIARPPVAIDGNGNLKNGRFAWKTFEIFASMDHRWEPRTSTRSAGKGIFSKMYITVLFVRKLNYRIKLLEPDKKNSNEQCNERWLTSFNWVLVETTYTHLDFGWIKNLSGRSRSKKFWTLGNFDTSISFQQYLHWNQKRKNYWLKDFTYKICPCSRGEKELSG